ncbi:MAG: 16S rRNA (uracil(1498)-N(3))-methyltransferase [Alphaproteobacteria bacterium]|nr:MAG: 16S rRNA (uracil(1498)-N(3))-methyltransferase [Alphaproteobacteria bacterium]
MTTRNCREEKAGARPTNTKTGGRHEGRAPPRLFVTHPLDGPGRRLTVGEDMRHYLHHVLRRGPGDRVRLFNGRDGEWCARIDSLERRSLVLVLEDCLRAQRDDPAIDLWLAFAPVKRNANEWIIEKATELGVMRLVPVIVRRGETRRVNAQRWHAIAREAAEQCERLSLPEIAEPLVLDQLLAQWPQDRRLFAARERMAAPHLGECLVHDGLPAGGAGLLVGPEGGFTHEEHARMAEVEAESGVLSTVSLGARILRAETAALAGLALIAARLDCEIRSCEEGADQTQ